MTERQAVTPSFSLGVSARRPAMRSLYALAVAVTTTPGVARAADEPTRPPDESPPTTGPRLSPPRPTRPFHWYAAAGLGSCARQDPNVGATGFCAEASVGLVYLFGAGATGLATDYRGPRFSFELGLGYAPPVQQGFADLGLTQSGGGPYALARVLVGYDWTALFFTQLGVESRLGYLLDVVAPGVVGVTELGTRALRSKMEVGVRAFAGVEPVESGGLELSNQWTGAFAYGAAGFARVLWP